MDASELIKKHFINTFEKDLLDEIIHCPFLELEKGTELRHQYDSRVRYTPLVISGSIMVTRIDENGKEILMYFIREKESCFLSITASLSNNFGIIDSLRAVVDEPSQFISLTDEQIRRWNDTYKSWRSYVAEVYNKRFVDFFSIVDSVVFKSVDEKVVNELNKLKNDNNEIFITHQELAIRIGSAREVVSRLLKNLEREGKIELSRKKIKIVSQP